MKYVIFDLVGSNCITPDDGQKVYDLIHPELVKGNAVELDFTGVALFASPFFNAAIGQLLKDVEPEQLNQLLTFPELSPLGLDTLRRVVENAKAYYSNPDLQGIMESILSSESEEL